ncbi:hypothetical protein Ccrd_005264, partial [Cynara cardunculus var. scolymus]
HSLLCVNFSSHTHTHKLSPIKNHEPSFLHLDLLSSRFPSNDRFIESLKRKKKQLLKMDYCSSFSFSRKVFAIIAVLTLFLSTGFSGELMRSTETTGDVFATPPALFQENEGIRREMIDLDYEDAGPNTNKRSGLNLPTPDPEAPAPQP